MSGRTSRRPKTRVRNFCRRPVNRARRSRVQVANPRRVTRPVRMKTVSGRAVGSNWYAYCGGNPVMYVDANGQLWSEIGSTVVQTFASGAQTIQSGFALASGVMIGDRQAGNAVAGQYFNRAMNNSVSGQVLSAGGSLGQAKAAAGILGVTLGAEGTLVGATSLFTTWGQTSIFYSGAGALDAATTAASAGEGAIITQTTGGVITEAAFGTANRAAWTGASWLYANAANESLVLLGSGGGAAGTILGDTELGVLAARGLMGGSRPLISAAAALSGLGGTAAAGYSSK